VEKRRKLGRRFQLSMLGPERSSLVAGDWLRFTIQRLAGAKQNGWEHVRAVTAGNRRATETLGVAIRPPDSMMCRTLRTADGL
jgi:hypothetical protein